MVERLGAEFPEILYKVNVVSVTLRLVLAMILGGILGVERGRKHRPAGFRTYMLVCLGTAVVMLTNQYVYECFGGGDPVRMGAQVISGIGFLGAGTIIVTGHSQVKGLTTAAGLWAAACIGLAIGIGFYEGAIIGGLAVIVIMTCFHRLDGFIIQNSRRMEMYVEVPSMKELNEFLKAVKEENLEVRDIFMDSSELQEQGDLGVIIVVRWRQKIHHADILEHLQKVPGVRFLEEV